VPLLMLTTACSISGIDKEANDSALCEGLKEPIDTWADTILEHQKETPAPVIIAGTRVIKGYDGGCS